MSNPYAPPSGGPRAGHRDQGTSATDGEPEGTAHLDHPTRTPESGPGHGRSGSPHPADPRTRPVDPEAARAASRHMLHFGLLMLASLITSSLPLPWQATALVFALAAIAVGVRALLSVWRSGMRGAVLAVLGVGLGLAALMSLSLVTMLALWPVQMERQACLRDALTISATQACETQYRDRLDQSLGGVTGTG